MPVRTRFALCTAAALLAACSDNPLGNAPSFLDCDSVRSLSLGSTLTQQLDSRDCVLAEDGTPVDYYTFTVNSDRTVSITMRSNDFDSYLFLLDDAGNYVTADDDGDPGSQYGSQIVVTLSPGRYYLGANSIDDTGGDYTLFAD